MFNLKSATNKAGLAKTIDALLLELEDLSGEDQEYAKIVDQLAKLHALKTAERLKVVDPNQLVSSAASLLGILMIIHHEQVGIVTTKALTFLPKLR